MSFWLRDRNFHYSASRNNATLCVSSVVGPALTFRIRQNERNMTAAEVAAKAGEAGKCTNTDLPTVRKWRKCRLHSRLRRFFAQLCLTKCVFSHLVNKYLFGLHTNSVRKRLPGV